MPEFYVGQMVRLLSHAVVSDAAKAHAGDVEVEGYEEFDGEDFVIVRVPAINGRASFTQLVEPGEIESVEEQRA